MSSKLSALLVQDRVVSIRQMDEAVERQRERGGRIGTNLLELGAIDADVLLHYLGKQRHLPTVARDDVHEVPAEALELWGGDAAREHLAVPVAMDERTLKLAVVDPLPDAVVAELADASGRTVQQALALEAQVHAALATVYGGDVPERYAAIAAKAPLGVRVVGKRPRTTLSLSARRSGSASDESTASDEADGGSTLETSEGEAPEAIPGLAWSGDALTTFLRTSDDRHEMLIATLGFLGKFFARRLLLVARGSALQGYALQMHGRTDRAVESLRVEARKDTSLGRVLAGGTYYYGPVAESGVGAVYEQLGLEPPPDVFVLPVQVRGRAIVVVVADGGDERIDARALPISFLAINRLSEGLERLIQAIRVRLSADFATVGAQAQAARVHDQKEIDAETAREAESQRTRLLGEVERRGSATASAAAEPQALPDAGWDFALLDSLGASPSSAPLPPTAPDFAPPGTPATDEPPTPHEAEPDPSDTFLPGVSDAAVPRPDSGGRTPTIRLGAPGPRGATKRQTAPLRGTQPLAPSRDEHVAAPTPAPPPVPSETAEPSRGTLTGLSAVAAVSDGDAVTRPIPRLDDHVSARAPERPPAPPTDDVPLAFERDPTPASALPAIDTGRIEPVELDLSIPGVLQNAKPVVFPRVIATRVDNASTVDLVGWLGGEDARLAEASFVALLDLGVAAHPALADAFPGPVVVDRDAARRDASTTPPETHGPLLCLVALQLRTFFPRLVPLTRSEDATARYYACRLLQNVTQADLFDVMAERAFDTDAGTREVALSCLEKRLPGSGPVRERVLTKVRAYFGATEAWAVDHAISAARRLKDEGAIGPLINALDHGSAHTRQRAAGALIALTLQDFGADAKAWRKWAAKHGQDGGKTWLLDAMASKNRAVRDNAARELRANPRIVVNYHAGLDSGARQTAIRAVHRALFGRDGGP
jgi:hypothetical protein